jgi:hypothetical protein
MFNVGTTDRLIRLVFASILLYLGLMVYPGSNLGIGLTVAGGLATFSGLVGTCFLYSILGINTKS